MLGPLLGSIAFGFAKGLTSAAGPAPASALQMNFLGPVKEELIYRGAPFWIAGTRGIPMGGTAVAFAADHVLSDARHHSMSAPQFAARFGDVLLGGAFYEAAYRSFGILGAVACHCAHNLACSLGSRMRR